MKKKFEEITKNNNLTKCNTIVDLKTMDLIAFEQLLDRNSMRCSYEEIKEKLYVTISRIAMDDVGYIVGDEYFIAIFKIYKKEDYGIFDLPLSIFPTFILPNVYKVKIRHPKGNKNYFPPDSDFAFQELDNFFGNIQVEEDILKATFDPEKRSWSVGNFEEKL